MYQRFQFSAYGGECLLKNENCTLVFKLKAPVTAEKLEFIPGKCKPVN